MLSVGANAETSYGLLLWIRAAYDAQIVHEASSGKCRRYVKMSSMEQTKRADQSRLIGQRYREVYRYGRGFLIGALGRGSSGAIPFR